MLQVILETFKCKIDANLHNKGVSSFVASYLYDLKGMLDVFTIFTV